MATALIIFRWLLVIGLLYFWVMPLLCNLYGPYAAIANRFRRTPLKHISPAPLIGSIAGIFMIMAIPIKAVQTSRWTCFIAFLPDLVFLLTLILALLLWPLTLLRRQHASSPK